MTRDDADNGDLPIKTENAPIVGEAAFIRSTSSRTADQRGRLFTGQADSRKVLPPGWRHKPEKTAVHKFDSEVQAWLFRRCWRSPSAGWMTAMCTARTIRFCSSCS